MKYKRHLDCPKHRAITNSTAMTAAEHKSDFELTKDPVSRASYGVFVVRSGENYIVIIPSHCI